MMFQERGEYRGLGSGSRSPAGELRVGQKTESQKAARITCMGFPHTSRYTAHPAPTKWYGLASHSASLSLRFPFGRKELIALGGSK